MQEPIAVEIGPSKYGTRPIGAKRCRDTMYYVPLQSTLKQLLQLQSVRDEIFRPSQHTQNVLNDESVRDEIFRPSQHTQNVLNDVSDGEFYKAHPLFSENSHVLQTIAYYDEVETCNVLGSSSGKHKLGCIFFTLGNIRPAHHSALKAIFLVLVAKLTTIKSNGIDSILKALVAFLADNLAAHELGGFKESFSFANRFCRSCLTNKE